MDSLDQPRMFPFPHDGGNGDGGMPGGNARALRRAWRTSTVSDGGGREARRLCLFQPREHCSTQHSALSRRGQGARSGRLTGRRQPHAKVSSNRGPPPPGFPLVVRREGRTPSSLFRYSLHLISA